MYISHYDTDVYLSHYDNDNDVRVSHYDNDMYVSHYDVSHYDNDIQQPATATVSMMLNVHRNNNNGNL